MKKRFIAGMVAVMMMGGAALGQAAFEVATVKPAAPLDMAKIAAAMRAGEAPKIGAHVEGGRAEYNYMALRDLIALAYSVKPYQVSGPEWMATIRFDILAKMPEGASKDDARAMLQTLLKDRFKLVAHRSTEEQPVLALMNGKNGPKLKSATVTPQPIDENAPLKPGEMKVDTLEGPTLVKVNPDRSTTINMGVRGSFTQKMDMQTRTLHIESSAVTMAGFADMLTRVMQMGGESNRQVVDMTGLAGYYQVNLDIPLAEVLAMMRARGMNVPMSAGSTASGAAPDVPQPNDGETVLESVQALGLKLEGRKASVARLVVDSVAKAPTEN